MPYIAAEDWEKTLLARRQWFPKNPGQLNYVLTLCVKDYWDEYGPSYQAINDIVGALESAKAEFQRRVVAPYEDKKIALNGDVY